jgi:hypothetical protein
LPDWLGAAAKDGQHGGCAVPGFIVRRTLLAVAAAFAVALAPVAFAGHDDVAIQYRLLTSFAGAERANGRIVVNITNLSGRPLSDLTLRLADQGRGRITGPIQENISLAAGETRTLEGDFVLDVAAIDPGRALEWIVVFSDAAGFAHQAMVRADPMLAAALDADARAPARSHP